MLTWRQVQAVVEKLVRPKEVYALAREAGFKKGVVYRARKALEGVVVNTEKKMSPSNLWALAEEG